MNKKKRLNLGASIIGIGYLGLISVSFILAKGADMTTKEGRHLLAGSLANVSFCFSQIMITNFALRNKGEKWAWWSNAIPALGYGLVILITDALHVPKEKLLFTLLPQAGGLFVLAIGLIISAREVFKK